MQFTPRELVSLAACLEMHLQGMVEARREMEADRHTLDNLDDFMDVMGRAAEDELIVRGLVRKINAQANNARGERATRVVRALSTYVRGNVGRFARRRYADVIELEFRRGEERRSG